MTWVKICGTTNLDDALCAADAGADAIGFVFGPSKRQVTPDKVASIVAQLPAQLEKIGVFLNESAARIAEIVAETGLTGVQLHGDETPQTAQLIAASTLVKVVKGIHAGSGLQSDLSTWAQEESISALLLDSGNGTMGGGTGMVFDWDLAAEALRILPRGISIIVAGGLNPENVARAIDKFHPWGVDVVSGVESEPGKKDIQKVKAFVAAVRKRPHE
jgi:phosphoribosylanthranilate isomerase